MFNSVWPRSVFYIKTLLLASPQKCIISLCTHVYAMHMYRYITSHIIDINLATCTHLQMYIPLHIWYNISRTQKSILRKLKIVSDCVSINWACSDKKKFGCGHGHFSRDIGNNYELNEAFLAYIELLPFKPIFIALLYC